MTIRKLFASEAGIACLTFVLLVVVIGTIIALADCWGGASATGDRGSQDVPPSSAPPAAREAPVFLVAPAEIPPRSLAGDYRPVEVKVHPAVPEYDLPLDLAKLTNADFGKHLYEKSKAAPQCDELLRKNGFAVLEGGGEDIAGFYGEVKARQMPIFITSDSLLHLYHIQFDQTLKDIEERVLSDDLLAVATALRDQSLKLFDKCQGDSKDAARLLVGYSSVPAVLLGAKRSEKATTGPDGTVSSTDEIRMPGWAGSEEDLNKDMAAALADLDLAQIPKIVDEPVRAELGLIFNHKGMDKSPLMGYQEDYSQYVPRGHYTRSLRLANYFRASMWSGRMTFLLRQGLVSERDARVQTLAACLLATMMDVRLPDGRTVAQAWQRLYAVTNFYVGFSDDLTPAEYLQAVRGALGRSFSVADLSDDGKLFEVRKRLALLRRPDIFSGLGDPIGPPVQVATEADLAQVLADTQGLRLMGQRYVPDSFVMGRLVYPSVGQHTATDEPFTLVQSKGGPIRGFPRGLDVMCVLGSARARHWLGELGDDQYERFDTKLAELNRQFDALDDTAWNRNAYWSWLHAIGALLEETPKGYPTFMRTDAWQDKEMSAALASWSQLRHDTILYAKQSYTMGAGSAVGPHPKPKMVEGYVEPVPVFYARLLALTGMTIKGLDDLKALDDPSRGRLKALEKIVARLLELTNLELENKPLTEPDYVFIRSFGDELKSAVAGITERGLETTIVADVHTDTNSEQALEEGTGRLNYIVVVYPMPDGGLVAGVGPILSHYEFKQPIANRLTDEAWKDMLNREDKPQLPPWSRAFTAGR